MYVCTKCLLCIYICTCNYMYIAWYYIYDIICRKSYHTKQGNRNHTWWLWYQEMPDQSNNSTCSAHRNASHTCRVMCPVSSSTGGGVRGCGCSGVLGAGLRPLKNRLSQLMSNYIKIYQHIRYLHVFTKCAVNTAVVFGKLQCVDLVNWYIRSANMHRLLWDLPKSCAIYSTVPQLLPLLLKTG